MWRREAVQSMKTWQQERLKCVLKNFASSQNPRYRRSRWKKTARQGRASSEISLSGFKKTGSSEKPAYEKSGHNTGTSDFSQKKASLRSRPRSSERQHRKGQEIIWCLAVYIREVFTDFHSHHSFTNSF